MNRLSLLVAASLLCSPLSVKADHSFYKKLYTEAKEKTTFVAKTTGKTLKTTGYAALAGVSATAALAHAGLVPLVIQQYLDGNALLPNTEDEMLNVEQSFASFQRLDESEWDTGAHALVASEVVLLALSAYGMSGLTRHFGGKIKESYQEVEKDMAPSAKRIKMALLELLDHCKEKCAHVKERLN